jgi:hypothetical protein
MENHLQPPKLCERTQLSDGATFSMKTPPEAKQIKLP